VPRTNTPASKLTLISAVAAVGTLSLSSFAYATPPVITSVTGSVTQGGTITISGSNFGVKSPAKPYLWAPMNGSTNPSSLGVVQSWASMVQLSYQANCGPATGTGCAAGTPSNGTAANEWTAAIYSPSPSGSGNDWNSYGQQTYVYRKSKRNFAYSNNGSTNVKLIRMWGTSASQFLVYPDFYWSVWNGRIGVEYVPPNSTIDYTMPNASISVAEGPVNQWYSEEYEIKSNSGPTTADGDFRVAINGGADLVSFPNSQWETNTITLKSPGSIAAMASTGSSAGDGTMKLLFPVHFVYENGGPWLPAPSGSQYFTADVYADTTWARHGRQFAGFQPGERA